MDSRRVLCAVFALTITLTAARAQSADTSIKTMRDAELLIPRPHRQSVKSLVNDGSQALDTIETASPGVKIILLANNTWKYWRDPSDIMLQEEIGRAHV